MGGYLVSSNFFDSVSFVTVYGLFLFGKTELFSAVEVDADADDVGLGFWKKTGRCYPAVMEN